MAERTVVGYEMASIEIVGRHPTVPAGTFDESTVPSPGVNPLMPAQPPLRYFRHEDLAPHHDMVVSALAPSFFNDTESAQINEFCRKFSAYGHYEFTVPASRVSGHVRMFVAMLEAMGAVRVSIQKDSVVVDQSGRLARHVPQIMSIYLERHHILIDDWNRSGVLREDRLNAVHFVQQLELRRIELERRSGYVAEPLAERPVAFGIFRALNGNGQSCYLFETNKDWQRLNLIGGKQELEDCGDFHATLKREISEELGISPARVTLSQLNDSPIIGYGLSGNVGSLARYPCMLFGVTVEGAFRIRPKDTWITEDAIQHAMNAPDCPIMVNPEYMSFLLAGSPSRLSRCPLTTPAVISGGDDPLGSNDQRPATRAIRYVRENKELLAAMLTLVAALITVILAF